MPAWITSLLRDDVTVPIPSAASRTITSRPACARRRATARPITPAPVTTHSTLSIRSSDPAIQLEARCPELGCVEDQSHSHTIALPKIPIYQRFPVRFAIREALIMSGQLP